MFIYRKPQSKSRPCRGGSAAALARRAGSGRATARGAETGAWMQKRNQLILFHGPDKIPGLFEKETKMYAGLVKLLKK